MNTVARYVCRKLTLVHRSVTMAQCTKAFVKGDRYGFSEEQNVAQAAA